VAFFRILDLAHRKSPVLSPETAAIQYESVPVTRPDGAWLMKSLAIDDENIHGYPLDPADPYLADTAHRRGVAGHSA